MKLSIMKIAAVAALALSGTVFAQTVPDAVGPSNGELRWNGSINASCNLTGFVDGTVVANLNQTKLSSTLSGGAAAFVESRTNVDGFTLVFGAPRLFNGAGEDVSYSVGKFDISPMGSGRRLNGTPISDFGATNGDLVFTNAGFYKAAVDAEVTAPVGAAFPAGTYIVRVPVTCTKS